MSQKTLEESWPKWLPAKQIPLGLDLKGGSSILLEVDLNGFIKERLQGLSNEIRQSLRKAKIGYVGLKVEGRAVSLNLRDPAEREAAYAALRKFGQDVLITTYADGLIHVAFSDAALLQKEGAVISQSIEMVRRRIDEMGTKEPLIQRQGSNQILVQLPGVADPSEAKSLIGKTAKMTFHLVRDEEGAASLPGTLALKEELTYQGKTHVLPIYLNAIPFATGEMLIDSQPAVDPEHGGWSVSMSFDAPGAKRMAEATANNIGKRFAVVLDQKIISAPSINMAIPSGRAQITGRFTAKEATNLATLFRAGALPAPLTPLEERTVGPDLGADSVEMGKNATIIASLFVFLFMFLFYGGIYGGIANIALFFNLIMLLSALALLQATLTLPGIAGIAITLGMAVDANVLIFERIKEELRHGKSTHEAIDAGFHRAMSTIVDSNLTTIIVAGLLYQFGTGAVRGFAVTLALGIMISMFTAVTATRTFITVFYNLFGAGPLSFGIHKKERV